MDCNHDCSYEDVHEDDHDDTQVEDWKSSLLPSVSDQLPKTLDNDINIRSDLWFVG